MLSCWKDPVKSPPTAGKPVVILRDNLPQIAYYFDGEFYDLELDNVLGILRKHYVGEAEYWADYIPPFYEDG